MTETVIQPESTPVSPARAERRPWRWLLGAIVVAVLVAAGLLAWVLMPRHPREHSAEAGFARDMITHHEQAVEMALLVRDRSEDPFIRSMATDMILTQTNQMGQMMGSAGGWVMMIVMGALAITAIVALVALSVFLIRRSRVAVAA